MGMKIHGLVEPGLSDFPEAQFRGAAPSHLRWALSAEGVSSEAHNPESIRTGRLSENTVSSEAQFSGANLRAPHSELRGAEFRARVELNCAL